MHRMLLRRGYEKPTVLGRYAANLGRLVEREMATAALIGAKQDAEELAHQAQQAMLEARASNDALRGEIQNRMQTQSRLAHLASHDPLTGLANRMLLTERLGRSMEQARRSGSSLALFCLDLDHFKDVNDTLGHAAGDALLREVATRLQSCLRAGETVGRMGGDEFAILQGGLTDPDGAGALAQRLLAAVDRPVEIAGRPLFIGVSIGITVFPGDGENPDQLLRNADLAMYRAKREGRNRYHFFDSALNREVLRRTSLEQALRTALALGQISVAYQPQVDLLDGRLMGVEALMRWNHPEFGDVSPDEFIPLAERCGLINGLGSWVLGQACRQAMAWDEAGLPPIKVAVNVAAAQFKGGDVPRLVADTLRDTGLAPSRVELEITKTGVMHDLRNSAEILTALHRLGVSLAIDDFGTGYSSLSYLRQLPVDKIKVDRSFVSDVTHSENAAVIASTIVTLGRNLRLGVVAEGVETDAHAEFVRIAGCGFGQGYFYGRPAASATIGDRLGGLIASTAPGVSHSFTIAGHPAAAQNSGAGPSSANEEA